MSISVPCAVSGQLALEHDRIVSARTLIVARWAARRRRSSPGANQRLRRGRGLRSGWGSQRKERCKGGDVCSGGSGIERAVARSAGFAFGAAGSIGVVWWIRRTPPAAGLVLGCGDCGSDRDRAAPRCWVGVTGPASTSCLPRFEDDDVATGGVVGRQPEGGPKRSRSIEPWRPSAAMIGAGLVGSGTGGSSGHSSRLRRRQRHRTRRAAGSARRSCSPRPAAPPAQRPVARPPVQARCPCGAAADAARTGPPRQRPSAVAASAVAGDRRCHRRAAARAGSAAGVARRDGVRGRRGLRMDVFWNETPPPPRRGPRSRTPPMTGSARPARAAAIAPLPPPVRPSTSGAAPPAPPERSAAGRHGAPRAWQ